MSVFLVYKKDGVKMMRPILTREEYCSLRDSDEQHRIIGTVRAGDVQRKCDLIQMNYSCMPNDDGTLKGSKAASNSVGMDIDFVAPEGLSADEQQRWLSEQMAAVPELVMSKKEALGLLMLERSASKGYHLVFRRHADMTQVENLRWASELLGVKYDDKAKDITRVFFTTTADENDLLYLDDDIFNMEQAVADQSVAALQCCSSEKNDIPAADPTAMYNGVLFSDIIERYWELFNNGKTPTEGDRNALTYELAVTLRSICDYSIEKMLQVVPNYWKGADGTCSQEEVEEWRQTIENALKEPRKGMPYRLKQVIQSLRSSVGVKACGGTRTSPPPMPKRLPQLIRLLIRNVPDEYKPAVASAVFPALGTHLHGVKFRYWDNVEHEATFMNLLIGRQSVGKSCIKLPVEFITADIEARDRPNRQREAEWKQKNPAARQKKDPRPTDICIQLVIDNLTDAVFNQRVIDAEHNGKRFIFTIVDELECLKKVTSSGKLEDLAVLIRKAFDNTKTGQERVGADSISGIGNLRWNFNASTTPPNARRLLKRMVNDGTVGRLDIATIMTPAHDDGEEGKDPVYGIYDQQFADELKPYIDRLEAASGFIPCEQARRLSLEMKRQNEEVARLYESEAFRVFSYRANVIAWLKGMVLYVAQGYRWDKTIADFVRWSQQYNLWCKMLYFGHQLERELREEVEIEQQSGPQNLLELLPDEFTKDQYQHMRQSQGKTGDGESTLRSWVKRGHIVFDDVSGRYWKTQKYKSKYSHA